MSSKKDQKRKRGKKALHLIAVEDGVYHLTPDGRDFLRKIDHSVVVASLMGTARQGKSELCGRLCGQPDMFETSCTVNAKTRGIWLSPTLIDDKVLILDTEGLGSPDSSIEHDVNIFSLAMLLSSVGVYNSVGPVTLPCLDELRLVAKVCQLIGSHSKLSKDLPHLLWLLRDFSLELVDRDGHTQTETEYMHSAMDKSLEVSAAIRKMYPTQTCITLPRPCSRDSDLKTMANLKPEYTAKVADVRSTLLDSKVKMIDGNAITGNELAALADAFCAVINSGDAVPNLGSVWSAVSESHALRVHNTTLAQYTSDLAAVEHSEQWEAHVTTLVADPLVSFDAQLLDPADKIRCDAIAAYGLVHSRAQADNLTACRAALEQAIGAFSADAQGVTDMDALRALVTKHQPVGLGVAYSTRVIDSLFDLLAAGRRQLVSDLESAKAASEHTRVRITELEVELESTKDTVDTEKAKHAKQLLTLDTTSTEARATMQITIDSISSARGDAERAAALQLQELELLRATDADTQETLDTLVTKVTSASGDIFRLTRELEQMKDELERERAENGELNVQCKLLRHNLTDSLEEVKQRSEKTIKGAEVVASKLERTTAALAQAMESVGVLESERTELLHEKDKLRAETDVRMADTTASMNDLRTKVSIAAAQCERHEQNARAAKKRKTVDTRVLETEAECKFLRMQTATHDKECARLRTELTAEVNARRTAEFELMAVKMASVGDK
jgi:hypothetical protein